MLSGEASFWRELDGDWLYVGFVGDCRGWVALLRSDARHPVYGVTPAAAVLLSRGDEEICSCCGWQDEYSAHPDPTAASSANGMSLAAARALVAKGSSPRAERRRRGRRLGVE